MAYTVLDTTGSTVTIDKGTKITSIGGRAVDLLLTGISAEDTAGRRRGRVLSKTPVVLAPFVQVNSSTLAFEYGTPVTVLAQTEEVEVSRWKLTNQTSQQFFGTSLAPESEVDIYLNNADLTQDFGILFAKAMDPVRGLLATGIWTGQFIPPPTVTTPGNANLGIAEVTTPGTPVTLELVGVDLTDQFEPTENSRIKRGDAKIVIPRTLSQAVLESPLAYFDLTPIGQSAIRYQVWAKGSVEAMQSYHWCIYLKRVRP